MNESTTASSFNTRSARILAGEHDCDVCVAREALEAI